MKATVTIEKSFDEGKNFTKQYEFGDFEEFFDDEGMYLDKLAKVTIEKGKNGDGFTITYTVTVIK